MLFKAADLGGIARVLRIKHAQAEDLKSSNGETQRKLVVYFHGAKKCLPLNLINYDTIAAIAGDESDGWPGTKIELYPTKTSLGGKTVDCIRMRKPAEAALPTPKADDEPPFDVGPPVRGAVMIKAALALAKRRMHVFPCTPRGKTPAVAGGCNSATTDEDTIRRWWREISDANVGVATGGVSNVFILDIDGVDAESELHKLEAKHGALPATVEAITPRGRHIWFKMPPMDIRCSAGKIAPGIDVRANGGYVLVPPSIHPSGRRYEWSVDCASAISDSPDWLQAAIGPKGKTGFSTGKNASAHYPVAADSWQALAKGLKEGARDCGLTRIAGHLLRHFVDPYLTLALVEAFNQARVHPPLPSADVERIVNSVARIEKDRRNGHGR